MIGLAVCVESRNRGFQTIPVAFVVALVKFIEVLNEVQRCRLVIAEGRKPGVEGAPIRIPPILTIVEGIEVLDEVHFRIISRRN